MLQVHILFGSSSSTDAESPFITILAVDPHIIIRGLEHNLHSQFHESSINGHDYLRTIVQLPLFIQVRWATMARQIFTDLHKSFHWKVPLEILRGTEMAYCVLMCR